MTEWKAAGRAPRDVDDALWKRFKAAQDVFFGRVTPSRRNATRSSANADAKTKLLDEAERTIDLTADLTGARAAFPLAAREVG